MFKSIISSLLVFSCRLHEIHTISNNRKRAGGARGCDTLESKNSFSFNRRCNYLARTLRTLAVESNGLGHKVSNGGHIGQPLRKPARGIN